MPAKGGNCDASRKTEGAVQWHCVGKGDYKMNGQNRSDVKIGARVSIVLKADQRTGKRTEGVVARLLTNSPNHPHGIKVMLEDGQVGRVQEIL